MIASQIVLNRNGIREAMDQLDIGLETSDDPAQTEATNKLLRSYMENEASDDPAKLEKREQILRSLSFYAGNAADRSQSAQDYYAARKELFERVYRLVEPLLDAPLPDDKGMESIMRYYGFFPEEAISPPHKP